MELKAKAELLGVTKKDTKKGEAVIITVMDGEVFEIWTFNDDCKKKAFTKKKGDPISLTFEARKFRSFMQVGQLVGVE